MATWHLLQDNDDNAIQYVSSLLKTHRNNEEVNQYWFPTPENPGDESTHTPIQRRILTELRNLQELEQLNPLQDEQSRQQFLSNFHWQDSMHKKSQQ